MAFTYRNVLNRPLNYTEIDENFQRVEELYEQCQQAVAASAVNGNMYQTLAIGLANTTDGEYFTVPSLVVDQYLSLYLNNNGVGDLIKTYLIPEASNFVTRDSADNIQINTASLSITQGNPTVDSVITDAGDGLLRKSTKQEFLDAVIGDSYLKEIYTEKVNLTASVSVDISDGTVQVLTLVSPASISLNLDSGQSLTLHVNGGDTYSVSWPTMSWIGGIPPTLTAQDVVIVWKVGTNLYGSYGGSLV